MLNYVNHKSRPKISVFRNYSNVYSMHFSQRSICFSFKNFGSSEFGNSVSMLILHIKIKIFSRVDGVTGVNDESRGCSKAGPCVPCFTSSVPTASLTPVSINRESRTFVCNSCRSKSAKSGIGGKPLHTFDHHKP